MHPRFGILPFRLRPPDGWVRFARTCPQRRLEFFEMLQRREELQTHGPSSGRQSLIGNERPTTDEVRALASYLSNNVVVFRPPHMSSAVLRKLLQVRRADSSTTR